MIGNTIDQRSGYVTPMEYIDDQESLEDFAREAMDSRYVAIDTEFLREKTYYPNLCLLQLCTEDGTYIVDPFAVDDLGVLAPLLECPDVLKLFHAGTQDIEILYREVGAMPWPIFDVQVAAALLGHSYQAGLASLLSSFLGVSIKKSDSFTDWTRRPLAPSQLTYAAEDVIYLPQLHETMVERLEQLGRLGWLDDEFSEMTDPANYEADPYSRYKRLKRGNQLNRKQMAAAREVAAWRELEAQKRDIPRKWVLSDEQIVEACKREASSIDDLFMVRGIKQGMSTRDAREVATLMRKAFASDESTWPKPEAPVQCEPNVDFSLDLMQALMRARSKETGIAMQTLGSHGDMALLARGHVDECPLMKGWRREIVGNDLVRLLDGEVLLGLNDNELVVVEPMDAR